MVRRRYALAPETVKRVDGWRHLVGEVAPGVPMEQALAVMACESGGDETDHQGLFQFTEATWAVTLQRDELRTDPSANIAAMAERVGLYGWMPDWGGGPYEPGPNGRWGTGPRGNGCW